MGEMHSSEKDAPDPALALVTAAIHMTRHPRHPHYCRCDELANAALSALPAGEVERERDQLLRWKREATTLFDGLQDLGRALDLPLGVLVTGPLAIEAAETLRAERDAALGRPIPPAEPTDGAPR